MNTPLLEKEFTAKEIQSVLRIVTGGLEKIGLALLNYYSRTNLVPASGNSISRGRNKYTYSDSNLAMLALQNEKRRTTCESISKRYRLFKEKTS